MQWAKKQKGFTIVELLIVIVVIAILAAITIVAYNGIQNRAKATAAQQGISQANKKILAFSVDNSDTYPEATSTNNGIGNLVSLGINNTGDTTYQYSANNDSSPRTFCITATNSNQSFYLSNSVTKPTSGACPGHGSGGASPITNMAVNPSFENGGTSYTLPGNAGAVIASDWAASGSSSMKMTPPNASSDSFFGIGGDVGAFRAGMQAGKTYTISGTVRLTAPLTGSLIGNGSRQITAWYTTAAGANVLAAQSNQAPNSAGTTRVSVTFSIPSDATGAWLRFYHGGSSGSGTVWFDNIMITEGSTQYNYADGSSSNWVWNGTANNATSTGSPL